MALADPQSVTINSVAQSMPRVGISMDAGSFQNADGSYALAINHQIGKRNRHTIRLTGVKTTADPLVPSQNSVVSMSTYIVVDVPKQGYTAAEAKLVVDGFLVYLAASSGATITKLLGFES